jgi:L-seryl-tRNA(Ser) seleniumtransferase
MDKRQDLLRQLPKIDDLLADGDVARHADLLGRRAVVDICRQAVDNAKAEVIETEQPPQRETILEAVATACRRARSNVLDRVINGTGVLLHTNLGRAPLGADLLREVADRIGGYCNLEINVLERQRGIRGPHVSSLLSQACGAEDALVVNNNAAALLLILGQFAAGRRVVISRGELIQIGGGFRIPEILASSGAILAEVGTTNITTVADYENALGDDTAVMLKVHHSNFRIEGFTESPEVRDLAPIKREGTLLVSDLGSGNLVRGLDSGAIGEPTPGDMLAAGADLVCFSCDKMLGGVQGGAIAGKRDLISALRKNPVMRAIRVDKVTYAALQVVLSHHLAGRHERVTLWEMASASQDQLRRRVTDFVERLGLDERRFTVVDTVATFGGGSTPGEQIPSAALRLSSDGSPDAIARWFQGLEPPVIGTVKDGQFQIDFRTVLPEDEELLAVALRGWEDSSR